MKNLVLIQYYCLILRLHSGFDSCPVSVFLNEESCSEGFFDFYDFDTFDDYKPVIFVENPSV